MLYMCSGTKQRAGRTILLLPRPTKQRYTKTSRSSVTAGVEGRTELPSLMPA